MTLPASHLPCCGRTEAHAADCWTLDPQHLPWHRPFRDRRCTAAHPRTADDAFYGRCELRAHGEHIDHALERGMEHPRWSTRWTG
jgi:hypothetical protein